MTHTSKQVGWDEPDVKSAALQPRYAGIRAASASWDQDETAMIVDARGVAYQHFYGQRKAGQVESPRLLVETMSESILEMCRSAKTNRIVLVWDGSVDYKRKIWPAYKIRHDRHRTDEEIALQNEFEAQLRSAITVFTACGIPQSTAPIEADDLAGLIVGQWLNHDPKHPINPFKRLLLISDDRDWYQLVCGGIVLLYRSRIDEVADRDKVIERIGVPPEQYADCKAFEGEPEAGDNIPGVPGVGFKTAQKWVLAHGSARGALAAIQHRQQTSKKIDARSMAVIEHRKNLVISYHLSLISTTVTLSGVESARGPVLRAARPITDLDAGDMAGVYGAINEAWRQLTRERRRPDHRGAMVDAKPHAGTVDLNELREAVGYG